MARIRSLKPEFFKSITLAELPGVDFADRLATRLTFEGLWCYADDYGCGRDDARLIAAEVWPLDDEIGSGEVREHLRRLSGAGLICRYQVDGKHYLHLTSWIEHQKISHPAKSPIPECPKERHGGGDDPSDLREQADSGNSPEPRRSDAGAAPETLQPSHARAEQGAWSREHGREVPPSAGRTAPADDPPTFEVLRGGLDTEPDATDATAPNPPPAAKPVTTQDLIAGFVDRCERRPPGGYLKRLGREIKRALDEGIPPEAVARALEIVRAKALQPSALSGCVQQILNPPEPRAGRGRAGTAGGNPLDYIRDQIALERAGGGG